MDGDAPVAPRPDLCVLGRHLWNTRTGEERKGKKDLVRICRTPICFCTHLIICIYFPQKSAVGEIAGHRVVVVGTLGSIHFVGVVDVSSVNVVRPCRRFTDLH